MTERGILLSAPMVRALLDGSKTQTRRVVKPEPIVAEFGMCRLVDSKDRPIVCPYGQSGDRLWVRETWAPTALDGVFQYRASSGLPGTTWRPSIHMPRAASRILLEITGVRVERLQDISEDDCWAEGIDAVDGALDDMTIIDLAKRMDRSCYDAVPTYAALWESINGAGIWDANPWVWVIEFKQVNL
jgi:hypothetical protein